jgi:hypothetical protein
MGGMGAAISVPSGASFLTFLDKLPPISANFRQLLQTMPISANAREASIYAGYRGKCPQKEKRP